MMFACPATNHGAASECGNIVNSSLLSLAFSVELAVARPPPDDCKDPSGVSAAASVCPAHMRRAGTALSASSIHIQIVFRDSTFSASPRLVVAHRRRANGRISLATTPALGVAHYRYSEAPGSASRCRAVTAVSYIGWA